MKFNLTANITISVYTEVEAETIEEAIEIAKERELTAITRTGGFTKHDSWICVELDGDLVDISKA